MSVLFVESPHVTRVASRTVDVIVIHTMEITERDDAAHRCASWFADPASKVSAHYLVDAATVIQCVRDEDVAWHARGGNGNSLGIELAGSAAQSAQEWGDRYSSAMMRRAAQVVASACVRHGIPVRRLNAAALRAGGHGITGHVDVTIAFGRSTHWDPGPAFPWAAFLRRVRTAHSWAVPPT